MCCFCMMDPAASGENDLRNMDTSSCHRCWDIMVRLLTLNILNGRVVCCKVEIASGAALRRGNLGAIAFLLVYVVIYAICDVQHPPVYGLWVLPAMGMAFLFVMLLLYFFLAP